MQGNPAAMTERVAAVLARAGRPAPVRPPVALSGGASSATYLVDCGDERVILQSAAAGEPSPGGLTRATQAEVIRRAAALGVPVPPVIAVPAPDDGLGDAAIFGFVPGEALAPRWLKLPDYAAARDALTGQVARALARLHAAPPDRWADLPLASGGPDQQLDRSFAHYRALRRDVPAFDLAFAWLKGRLPDAPAACLVHGDFRAGNWLIDERGLAAVLDWELTHLSVPEEDLGWMCVNAWRFGRADKPVGGFGERRPLLDAYHDAGGKRISLDELRPWEVFGNLKWGLSCLQLADDHVSGRVPSVERAAIGRRVAEVAADLVHLIRTGDL